MMMIWTTGLSICIDIDMIWNMDNHLQQTDKEEVVKLSGVMQHA